MAFPQTRYTKWQGVATVTDAAADATVKTAPSSGAIVVTHGVISVITAAVGGGGRVKLEDGLGGTAFINRDANTIRECRR